jgi:hypothetical protein
MKLLALQMKDDKRFKLSSSFNFTPFASSLSSRDVYIPFVVRQILSFPTQADDDDGAAGVWMRGKGKEASERVKKNISSTVNNLRKFPCASLLHFSSFLVEFLHPS